MLKPADIAHLRLASQQLVEQSFTRPVQLLEWMGAMQAQDFPMARWAIGARLPGITDAQVVAALDRAELIRTHLLRPTWHFVAARDVVWLLELTAPQVMNSQKSRDRALELTEQVYSKSNTVIEKALSTGDSLTREELVAELKKAKIATDQNRASHLFMRAELERIICSGELRNGKLTYALLSQRVPGSRKLNHEEALHKLAVLYFTSRCPATLKDFIWWSGLPTHEARLAVQLSKPVLHQEQIQGKTYWLPDRYAVPKKLNRPAFLLPTYDEFTLSYIDREAAIPAQLERYMKQISDRGLFRPIILMDGLVSGIWKRTYKKDQLIIELQLFSPPNHTQSARISEAITRYGSFVGKSTQTQFSE